jgi:hypothetical protein
MASYLLLRNNKESGPFNFDDLLKSGLKPYDLVWVEGKSAAWRYPSEIEELKPYAPATEEQPFDRFFKKTVPEEHIQLQQEIAVPEDKPVEIEEKYAKYIPKKSVFVTLPGQSSKSSAQPETLKPQVSRPQPKPEPVAEQTATPIITVTENPEAAKIKFSQPLDEIKEMYVKTLQQRKTKIARKNFLLANFKRAAVIIGLVALGVVAGLVINSRSDGSDSLARQTLQATIPTSPALGGNDEVSDNEPDQSQILSKNNNNTMQEPEPEPEPLSPQVKKQLQLQEEKTMITPPRPKRESAVLSETDFQQQGLSITALEPIGKDPVTGERSRKIRSESATDDKPVAKSVLPSRKSGLTSLVSVTSNEYKRVAFGGIRNLELTVTNDSKFILDKVTVELQYLKPSEEPLRTELVQFHTISPNGTMTKKIKDTNRGIKVSYRIIDIQPQQTETALRE